MKYRCKMCGYEGDGESLPITACPTCGMTDEWEANPFDARCGKCGQGYYESETPNFCPSCGERIGAPAPNLVIAPARQTGKVGDAFSARKSSVRSTAASSSSPVRIERSINWNWLKTISKFFGLASAAYAIWFFKNDVVYYWYVACDHWFVSAFIAWGVGCGIVKIMQQLDSRHALWRCARWVDWDGEWIIEIWNSRYGICIIFFVEILIRILGSVTVLISLLVLYLLFWWGAETRNKIRHHPILTCCCVFGLIKVIHNVILSKLT